MKKLFIDDIRQPVDNTYDIVRSYDDAIAYMKVRGCPSFITFDHDLGEAELKTGFDIAKWIVEQDLDDGGFIPADFSYDVHSANPVGAANIRGLLDNYLAVRDVYETTTGKQT